MVETPNTANDLRDKVSETAEAAKSEALKRADGAKASLAGEIDGVAAALAAASREFDRDSVQAKSFQHLSDSLSGTSQSIRNKSLGEMLNGLNAFARNNPAAFIGGAVALGFAASRFAIASESPPAGDNDHAVRSRTPTVVSSAPAPQPTGGPPEIKTGEGTP